MTLMLSVPQLSLAATEVVVQEEKRKDENGLHR